MKNKLHIFIRYFVGTLICMAVLGINVGVVMSALVLSPWYGLLLFLTIPLTIGLIMVVDS